MQDETHCKGTSINTWAHGTSSSYATMSGIENCKAKCDEHPDCLGFVHSNVSNGQEKCGYWKGGTLAPYNHADHRCYTKGKLILISKADFCQVFLTGTVVSQNFCIMLH